MKSRNSHITSVTLTLRLKVKPESYIWLNSAACETNQVWNFCNERSRDALGNRGIWLSGFDLCNQTSGATKYLKRIGADTIQRVCTEYAAKRKAVRKRKLGWRVSSSSRRSLGWVPFKAENIKLKGNVIRFAKKTFRIFEAKRLIDVKGKQGCFAEDSVGDWWLCVPIEQQIEQSIAPAESVGIDLGLKSIATTSDGDVLSAGRWMHNVADKLALAQRRGHKRNAKRLYRKVARQRHDVLHKFSRKIVNQYQKIVIGDVSSTKLVKTKMAKSVLDSGWGMLKNFLDYKSQLAARSFLIVNESYTSRACSSCGSLSGPRGLNMLSVRTWECADCGESHDRDINAAKNILRSDQGDWSPSAGTSRKPQEAAA